MNIISEIENPVNTRYWSGSPVVAIGDAFLVIDRNTGFVTLLRHGSDTNVVGTVAISELRQALQPKPVLTTWSGDYSDVLPDYMRDDYVGM